MNLQDASSQSDNPDNLIHEHINLASTPTNPHSLRSANNDDHNDESSIQMLQSTNETTTPINSESINPSTSPLSMHEVTSSQPPLTNQSVSPSKPHRPSLWNRIVRSLKKVVLFAGPGLVISVAYMDPGNYQTGLAAGSQFGYRLLFIVLLASIAACILQALAIKLGSVTGKDLAQVCKENCPNWLRYVLWTFNELSVIATDFAEVIGFTVALYLLFSVPLQAGVMITLIDVIVVLLLFKDNGTVRELRYFEVLISFFVIGAGICFLVELTRVKPPTGDVLKGYLPSISLFTNPGEFYAALGIIGATVMPHSLFIGTRLAPVRVKNEDAHLKLMHSEKSDNDENASIKEIVPNQDIEYSECSIRAIVKSLPYAYLDSAASLLTLALFVNSAIVIVSAATFYNSPDAENIADLFSAYDMLTVHLGKGAAILFALALLFSGQSSSVVATLAGQIIAEGFMKWKIKPWIRRLLTRSITVIPSMLAVTIGGRGGLADLLIASQAALSILLPFAMIPLIWFTSPWCKLMKVERPDPTNPTRLIKHDFSNGWFLTGVLIIIALGIVLANMYSIAMLIKGT